MDTEAAFVVVWKDEYPILVQLFELLHDVHPKQLQEVE